MKKGVGWNERRRSGLGENGRRIKKGDIVIVEVADQEARGVAMMMTVRTTDRETEADDLPPRLEVEAARVVHHGQNMMTSGS